MRRWKGRKKGIGSNDRRGLRFAIIGWLIVTRGNNVIYHLASPVGNATSRFHLLQNVRVRVTAVSIQIHVYHQSSSCFYQLLIFNYQVSTMMIPCSLSSSAQATGSTCVNLFPTMCSSLLSYENAFLPHEDHGSSKHD